MKIEASAIITGTVHVKHDGAPERAMRTIDINGGGCTIRIVEDGTFSIIGNGFSKENLLEISEMADNFDTLYSKYYATPRPNVPSKHKRVEYRHQAS